MFMLSLGDYKVYSILKLPKRMTIPRTQTSLSCFDVDELTAKLPPLLTKLNGRRIVLNVLEITLEKTLGHSVHEGVMSPVSSAHDQSVLLSDRHRIEMLRIATKNTPWLRVDTWQCSQEKAPGYADLLYHLHDEYIHSMGPNAVHLMLLCGSDVIESFDRRTNQQQTMLSDYELKEVVSRFGIVALFRPQTEPSKTIYSMDVLRKYEKNIYLIEDETVRLRTAIRRNESVRFCADDRVIDYIYANNLYSHRPEAMSRSLTATNRESMTLDELFDVSTQWASYFAAQLANSCTTTNDDQNSMRSFSAMETSAPAALAQTTPPPNSSREAGGKYVHFDLCSQASAASEPCLSSKPSRKKQGIRLHFRQYNLTSTPETTV
ncbi:Nicotinamide-nucleotide adenylyltransferase [Aphelenchoides fujianensis]|nr:Nicotinamide-nucleotide adenylyltransferase [Aphelenchoides fujianensis]